MEFTLLAAAAFGVTGFWIMLRCEAKRGNAAGCSLDLWDAGLTTGSIGLLVGRLTAMLLNGINPLTDPAQIILVRSGVSTVGASIGAIAAFAFIARRSLLESGDAIGPSVLGGLAGWHLGTIVSGTWLGQASSLPWAQAAAEGSSTTRHPVEIYAAIVFFAAAMALATWKQRGRPPLGVPAGLSIAATGSIRLITEPLRVSLFGGPVWFYAAGAIVGLGLAWWASRQARTPS